MRTYLFIFDDSYKPDLLMFVMLLVVLAFSVLISYSITAFRYLKSMVKLVKVIHPDTDRMLGFRTGHHNERAYFRLDFWSFSYRIEFGEQSAQNNKTLTVKETHNSFDCNAR